MEIRLKGKYLKSNGTAHPEKTSVKLIDNFIPYLYSKIEVKKHNHFIDEVEHPGITSSIKAIVSYKSSDGNALTNCGYISRYVGDINTFYVLGDLAHLGLGFFEDINTPIYKGGFTITFIRSDDSEAFHQVRFTE